MNKLLRQSQRFCKRHGATILTYVGGAGVIVTSVMAVKATPKALKLIENAEEEKGEELTKVETVKTAWKPYIPAMVTGVSTIVCVFGANVLNKRQQAALISAYAFLDNSYKEYKKKAQELYGADGVRQIGEEIAKDKYEKQEIEEAKEGDNTKLFYDSYSQRFFRATNEEVLMAAYEINKTLTDDGGATLNELYACLGIPGLDHGHEVGWNASQMYEIYWSSWIDFHYTKSETRDGEEYFVIDFTEPTLDFDDCY